MFESSGHPGTSFLEIRPTLKTLEPTTLTTSEQPIVCKIVQLPRTTARARSALGTASGLRQIRSPHKHITAFPSCFWDAVQAFALHRVLVLALEHRLQRDESGITACLVENDSVLDPAIADRLAREAAASAFADSYLFRLPRICRWTSASMCGPGATIFVSPRHGRPSGRY